MAYPSEWIKGFTDVAVDDEGVNRLVSVLLFPVE
jgi:hypothetical protein